MREDGVLECLSTERKCINNYYSVYLKKTWLERSYNVLITCKEDAY